MIPGGGLEGVSPGNRKALKGPMVVAAIVVLVLMAGAPLAAGAKPPGQQGFQGHVRDITGVALGSARIYVDGALAGTTDGSGFYKVSTSTGSHTLRASLADYLSQQTSGSVVSGIFTQVDFALQSAGIFGMVYHPDFFDDATDAALLAYLRNNNIRVLLIDIGWSVVEPVRGARVWSAYDRFFDLASSYGISLVPGPNVDWTPSWVFSLYNDSEQLSNTFQPIRAVTHNLADIATVPWAMNHTAVRSLAASFTTDAVNRYKNHPAFGGTWILANEPNLWDNETNPSMFFDYSASTNESFRRWAFALMNPGTRYNGNSNTNLAALLQSWGFPANTWTKWSQVIPPTAPDDSSPARDTTKTRYWGDWMAFREQLVADFIQWHASTIKAADGGSKVLVKLNSWVALKPMLAQAALNYYTIVKRTPSVDVYGLDFYPHPDPSKTLLRDNELVMHISALRALLNDYPSKRFWIGETGEYGTSGGTAMSATTARRYSELSLAGGVDKVIFYDMDPTDIHFSFFYNQLPSPALQEIGRMSTDPDIKAIAASDTRFKPQVAVVFGVADVQLSPYFYSGGTYYYSTSEIYSKHVTANALYEANLPYALLYDNYIKERGVPAYVKVLFLPYVVRMSDTTANNIRTFVQNTGGYAWGDFTAGEYSLERQTWLSGDGTAAMNQVFSATFAGPIWDTSERPITITDSSTTPDLPVGSTLWSLHNENAITHGGTRIAKFADDSWAIWVTPSGAGQAERVASALAVRSYQRFDTGLDITNFNRLVLDWALYGKAVTLTQVSGDATLTISVWDITKIGDSTTTFIEYFARSPTGGSVTFLLRNLAPNTRYLIQWPGNLLYQSTAGDGKLQFTITLGAGIQTPITVQKAP